MVEDRPHQIVHIGTGVRPRELQFPSHGAAQHWLDHYGVSAEYKQQNYRIVPMEQVESPGFTQ